MNFFLFGIFFLATNLTWDAVQFQPRWLSAVIYVWHCVISCCLCVPYQHVLRPERIFFVFNVQHHGATRFASTSVVQQSSGGLFSWLLGGKSNELPPLDVPLSGVTIPQSLPDFVEPSKTKITTLSNGVKIASETSQVLFCSQLCYEIFIFICCCCSSLAYPNLLGTKRHGCCCCCCICSSNVSVST
jgi:hypothetical protein